MRSGGFPVLFLVNILIGLKRKHSQWKGDIGSCRICYAKQTIIQKIFP